MNNVLYRRAIRTFNPELDIDSAPCVWATEENNHFHVWTTDDHKGTTHHGFYWTREDAIEAAVKMKEEMNK